MSPGAKDDRRDARIHGLLTEISLQCELRDEAYASAETPAAAWLESGELGRRARSAQDGLEALVLTALEDPEPPSDEEIARAAGIGLEDVQELRERLERETAAAAEPARKRRFGFRR